MKTQNLSAVRLGLFMLAAMIGWVAAIPAALACPFCAAVSKTLGEELESADYVVLIKLAKPADISAAELAATSDPDMALSTFEIVKVLKGETGLSGTKEIKILYFGDNPVGSTFLSFGVNLDKVAWGTPVLLSDRAVEYVSKLPVLPAKGTGRLRYFLEFLEDEDPLLAGDAYDEFARAPYSEVVGLKSEIEHDKIVKWIADKQVTPSRRRLYLTLLGICGSESDTPFLEDLINSPEQEQRSALDALIACYINLKGPTGLDLIDDKILSNEKSEYTDTYAAIMALRFHGQETQVVPKERLLKSFRLMLERPTLADLIIPDLARWQDWSAMDRLVKLFKDADQKSQWVRVPVLNYLRACPKEEAKEYLKELAAIDPEAMKRAQQFFPLPGGRGTKKDGKEKTDPADKQGAADKSAKQEKPAKNSAESNAESGTNGGEKPGKKPSDKDQASVDGSAQDGGGEVRLVSTNAPSPLEENVEQDGVVLARATEPLPTPSAEVSAGDQDAEAIASAMDDGPAVQGAAQSSDAAGPVAPVANGNGAWHFNSMPLTVGALVGLVLLITCVLIFHSKHRPLPTELERAR